MGIDRKGTFKCQLLMKVQDGPPIVVLDDMRLGNEKVYPAVYASWPMQDIQHGVHLLQPVHILDGPALDEWGLAMEKFPARRGHDLGGSFPENSRPRYVDSEGVNSAPGAPMLGRSSVGKVTGEPCKGDCFEPTD